MVIIGNGWVLLSRTIMVLRLLTLQLYQVVISYMVIGPTHSRVGPVDLLITDVPDIVQVTVLAPRGNSDHSSLISAISVRKLFLKHPVYWTALSYAIRDLPWKSIWSADYRLKELNEHLPLLVERFAPT